MNNPKQEYLSSKDAGAIMGYTHDYISRLCRQGKISGIQKGREWFVTQEELEAFKKRHELELIEKKKELSKKFSKIRLEAEAKKREARQSLIKKEENPKKEKVQFSETPNQLRLFIPKQVIAALVLTLVVFSSTLIGSIGQKNSFKNNLIEISDNIENGVQETIYQQSTAMEPVASVILSAQDKSSIPGQVVTSIKDLPKETFNTVYSFGNLYLELYLMQGQIIYDSFIDLNTMGASILRGYELIGESVYFGGKDILGIYSRILKVDKYLETSSDKIGIYTANVNGGFDYVIEEVGKNVFDSTFVEISFICNVFRKNIAMNMSSIENTISKTSNYLNAYVGSLFEFNLIKKEQKIRAIKLEE